MSSLREQAKTLAANKRRTSLNKGDHALKDKVLLEAMCEKLSSKGKWQKRYFTVTQESLTYYDKKDGVAGAAMEIRMMVQATIQNESEVHCKFKNNEVYKLKLGTREETTRWAELLKGLIILTNAESVRSEEKHKNAPAGTYIKAEESEVSERISETSPKPPQVAATTAPRLPGSPEEDDEAAERKANQAKAVALAEAERTRRLSGVKESELEVSRERVKSIEKAKMDAAQEQTRRIGSSNAADAANWAQRRASIDAATKAIDSEQDRRVNDIKEGYILNNGPATQTVTANPISKETAPAAGLRDSKKLSGTTASTGRKNSLDIEAGGSKQETKPAEKCCCVVQ